MTNQEQYELICEKAKKYDRLVELLNKIRTEIKQYRRETQDIDLYDLVGDCLAIFNKYMPESEKV